MGFFRYTRIFCVFLLIFVCSAGHAKTDDPNHLTQRIEVVERELAIERQVSQNNRDINDKRLADFATLATMQGSHTTWVGNLVAIISVVITLLVFSAGFITYVSVKSRAVKEAQDAAERWFEKNARLLSDKVRLLEEQVHNALEVIASHETKVHNEASAVQTALAKKLREVSQAFESRQDDSQAREVSIAVATDVTASSVGSGGSEKPSTSSGVAEEYYRQANLFEDAQNYEAALRAFDAAIASSSESSVFDQAKYLASKGLFLINRERYEQSVSVFDEVIQRYSGSEDDGAKVQYAFSLLSKGTALGKLGQREEELDCFDRVAREFDTSTSPSLKLIVMTALTRKAFALTEAGDNEARIQQLNEIISKYGDSLDEMLQVPLARVLAHKGTALIDGNEYAEAISTLEDLVKRFESSSNETLAEIVAEALISISTVYDLQKLSELEMRAYDRVVSHFNLHKFDQLRRFAADALYYKGLTLANLNRLEDEIMVYNEIDRLFSSDTSESVRRRIAEGLWQKGASQAALGKRDVAVATFEELDRRFSGDSFGKTQVAVARALFRRAEILSQQGQTEEAVRLKLEFAKRYANASDAEVRDVYNKLSESVSTT